LIAATLLVGHHGDAAESLLLELANDGEPAVAAVAVRALLESNPARLGPLVPNLATQSNADLRKLAAQALKSFPAPGSVRLLVPMLHDPHQNVRIQAREALIALASMASLREPIERQVVEALHGAAPLGREQASVIVGALRYQPAAGRLVQLLDEASPVGVAAAWALRRVAVPETAAPMALWALKATRMSQTVPLDQEGAAFVAHVRVVHQQLNHLIEALGVLRYRPAVDGLRAYLPVPPHESLRNRSPLAYRAVWQHNLRAAAAWSLGQILTGSPHQDVVDELRKALEAEFEDTEEGSPEVRARAAISIARIEGEKAVPLLQKYYRDEKQPLMVHGASAWALEQITRQPVPIMTRKPREIWHAGWFLEPLEPRGPTGEDAASRAARGP
jgi:HEAT repeat protein